MKFHAPLLESRARTAESGGEALEGRTGDFGSHWLSSCYRLRHSYFVKERRWVDPALTEGEEESDRYDGRAHHVAVFQGAQPLAYLRALPCASGAMLDSEFASIMEGENGYSIEREGALELSRFVVSPILRDRRNAWPIHPVEHLLKALYHFARERDYERFYIVVEAGWPRVFARRFGLPFQVIGEPYVFPDGTRTVAAVATLAELEVGMRRHSLAKYEWYQNQDIG